MGLRAKSASTSLNANNKQQQVQNCKFLNGNKRCNNKSMPQQAILLASSNPGATTIGCIKSSASISTLAKQLQPNVNRETKCSITSIHSTTTYRSNSSSALLTTNNMRPQTLNVHNRRQTPTDHTQSFLGYVFYLLLLLFYNFSISFIIV